jgi:hypothetical protein
MPTGHLPLLLLAAMARLLPSLRLQLLLHQPQQLLSLLHPLLLQHLLQSQLLLLRLQLPLPKSLTLLTLSSTSTSRF